MNTELPLPSGQVDVWVAHPGAIQDHKLLAEYRRLLTPDEKDREQRFYFAADRRRYLITRALVRTSMSRYSSVRPDQWRFVSNAYGRPELIGNDESQKKMSFNIAHTNDLVLCAVSRGVALGVDTESIRPKSALLDIADRFFSADEAAALRALPVTVQHEIFFHYWTLKESYIKARNMGLSINLELFGFSFPGAKRICAWFHPELNDYSRHWRFWLFKPSANHVGALCVQRSAEMTSLVMRECTPLQTEELVEYPILRQSEH